MTYLLLIYKFTVFLLYLQLFSLPSFLVASSDTIEIAINKGYLIMADKIYSAEQITVPHDLPKILKGFAKEVIRYNPTDIPSFAIELNFILSLFANFR